MTRKSRKPLALAMMAALAAQPMALPVVAQAGQVASLEAQASAFTPVRNAWHNSYRVYNSPARAFLHEGPSGLERVQWTGSSLVVEGVSADLRSATSSKEIPVSTYLPTGCAAGDVIWGGFFSGTDANYVVTGQGNPSEARNAVVVRVAKYSKAWNYVDYCEYSAGWDNQAYLGGIQYPFEFGSCRMAEVDHKLYIHFGRTMFKTPDNLNHQSNATMIVSEDDMTPFSPGTEGIGYVSHSFCQMLVVDGSALYSADHGDGYPRAIRVAKLGGWESDILSFPGQAGVNYTGGSLGGLEAGSGRILVVGNLDNDEGGRDVWVASLDAATGVGAPVTVARGGADELVTPQLVKVSDSRFLMLWGVGTGTELRWCFLDAHGNVQGPVRSGTGRLSDCKPVPHDGEAVWYVGEAGGVVFYSVDLSSGELTRHRDSGSIADATIQPVGRQAVTGKPICPFLDVSYEGRALVQNVDYTVGYSDNVSVGTATATVTGIGDFTGTASVSFEIYDPKAVLVDIVTDPGVEAKELGPFVYQGAELHPMPEISYHGLPLVPGVDFDVTWLNHLDQGIGLAQVEGKGRYEGRLSIAYLILQPGEELPGGDGPTGPTNPDTPGTPDVPDTPDTPGTPGVPSQPTTRQGWAREGGTWCYYESGRKAVGWRSIEGAWYLFGADGAMATGWRQDGSAWYYLDPSGAMATGWRSLGGAWYYFDPSGAMATGWRAVGGAWYYLDPSGAMATGWRQVGGAWYYLQPSGAMATGWQLVNGTWYYFHPSGAMAANEWVGSYWIDASGAWRG